jgi:hypothetical protein
VLAAAAVWSAVLAMVKLLLLLLPTRPLPTSSS